MNNFVSLSIFLGLFLIAAFSLVSLSPISFEDYTAYQNYFDGQSSNDARVAGVYDEVDVEIFENLLLNSGLVYSWSNSGEKVSLHFSGNEKDIEDNLAILKINNAGYHRKNYAVKFTFLSQGGLKGGLFSSNGGVASVDEANYTISVEPGDEEKLSLILEKDADFRKNLSSDFEIGIEVNPVDDLQKIELDGEFINRLP